MTDPKVIPSVSQYVLAAHEELRKLLNSPATKVKVQGFPRSLLFKVVDVVPLLAKYIEDAQACLQMIAEEPKNGCPACKVASEMARECLKGKRASR